MLIVDSPATWKNVVKTKGVGGLRTELPSLNLSGTKARNAAL